MTSSVAHQLIRSGYLIRSMRLMPLMVGALAVATLFIHRGGTSDVTGPLRLVGLVLALACGFVLDDAAATTLQAAPYPLDRRLGLRIGFAAAIIAPLWGVALMRLLPSAPSGQRAALGIGISVELAAALFVVWSAAGWGRRRGLDEPGVATAPLLLGLIFVAVAQDRIPMVVAPGAEWLTVHLRWTAVLVGAVGCLAYEMRDPAARSGTAIARTFSVAHFRRRSQGRSTGRHDD